MFTFLIVCLVAAGVTAAFVGGVAVYVGGSYALMRGHTEPKPWRQLLREASTEFLWALVTQPFLPLYYLFGRRLGGGQGPCPVIFVHGYAQNRVGFIGMTRALGRRGLGPFYGFNYPWFFSIATNARRLARFIERVQRWTKSTQVDLVCHSMGGLVALEYMREAGDDGPVRRCVTVATPHAGVLWRGPILGASGAQLRASGDFVRTLSGVTLSPRVLSIYSTHDNIVYPPTSSMLAARGARDVSIAGSGHLAILFNREVID
ncbi:MAG: alpha/beta fold hydrolase, partial [Myxococcales bacterium]